MLRELEKNAVRKGLVQVGENWEGVSREDIYRQRVLGTRTGAEDFITYDDKRRLGVLSMCLYILFTIAAMEFAWRRLNIYESYKVNSVIRESIMRASYIKDMEEQTWANIQTIEDFQHWLVDAFPGLVSPTVQGFNIPLGEIRFTVRRMQWAANADERFKLKAPWVWKDKVGIRPSDQSTDNDNTTAFGAYRSWATNKYHQPALGLNWCELESPYYCSDGELLDKKQLPMKMSQADAIVKCKEWCGELTAGGKPCRCFDLTLDRMCSFYWSPEDVLIRANVIVNGKCPLDSKLPPLAASKQNTLAFWPQMDTWKFQEKAGWLETSGFVSSLRFWTQEELIELAGDNIPPTQAEVLKNQIKDWFAGGLASKPMASMAVDFVTYNPNYMVYTWVQLLFKQSASGQITSEMQLSSLKITDAMIKDQAFSIWRDLHAWDVVYGVLLIVYMLIEMFEFGIRGFQYFHSAWNWFTMFTLLLHVIVFISRWVYVSKQTFVEILAEYKTQVYTSNPVAFQQQFESYSTFSVFCALTLPTMFLKLVQHFNDIFPRVGVLVNTVYRAGTPIAFLMFITFDLFMAFVVFSYLMFGKSVNSYHTFVKAMLSSTELVFGDVTSFLELKEVYPVVGGIFAMIHVLLFIFVLQSVGKAVVVSSYEDSTKVYDKEQEAEEQRRRATDSPGRDRFGRSFETVQLHFDEWMNSKLGGSRYVRTGNRARRYEQSPLEVMLFTVFCILYIFMTYYMARVGWAHDLSASIRDVIEDKTYSMPDPIAGIMKTGKRFTDVQRREDVDAYLVQALPKTLFNSSHGTFEGAPNPLFVYQAALPTVFHQLVLNNWNIVLGQQPVRISARYFKMRAAGSERAHGGFIQGSTMLTEVVLLPTEISYDGTSFEPPMREATEYGEIVEPQAREVLQRHCAYKQSYGANNMDDSNGFSCMLSVDYNETMHILKDLTANNIINNQTATLAVDFVTYNAKVEMFVYVAILFQFQPSGEITRNIVQFPVKMDLYAGHHWYRIAMEMLIILLNFYFIGVCSKGICATVMEHLQTDRRLDPEPNSKLQRPWVVLRALVLHIGQNLFNLLDVVSCILTVVTMVLWYNIVFSGFVQQYFFPERPILDTSLCQADVCSDDEVIFAFYNEGKKVKNFLRIMAINTLIIFFRMLKYLQVYPRMRIIFSTLRRGAVDVLWYLLMLMTILMAFVVAGHQTFGRQVQSFHSIGHAFLACFQIAIGTFDLRELRDVGALSYFLYMFLSLAVIRFVMMNMFFGIVDKNYREEHAKLEEGEKVLAALSTAPAAAASPPEGGSLLKRAMTTLRNRRHPGGSTDPASPEMLPVEDLAGRLSGMTSPASRNAGSELADPASPVSHGPGAGALVPVPKRNRTGDTDDDEPETTAITADIVKQTKNFKYMPEDMKSWAVQTAHEVNSLIEEFHDRRFTGQHNKHDLDRILEEAESTIKHHRTVKHNMAEEAFTTLNEVELRSLKEIHQDQESLAWYIMKREAELKKLEAMRVLKQQRHDQLVQEARSIVEDNDEPPNVEDQAPPAQTT